MPDIVREAHDLAHGLNFPTASSPRPIGSAGVPSACIPEVGRLLQVLAAAKPDGVIAELGTGAGIGTAWLASGAVGSAHVISAELDRRLATAVAELFSVRCRNVEIRTGDWHDVLGGDGMLDLVFVDAPVQDDLLPTNWDRITELVNVGGQIVMDDLTPVELWPAEWVGSTDPKREFAFANPRVIAAEVRTTPITSALVITRIR